MTLEVTIRRSNLHGSVRAPPSKSYTHRAMFCAALARGESRLHLPLICDDTIATSEGLSRMGVKTDWNDSSNCIIQSEGLKKPRDIIFCRESGTTLRFMMAVCATTPHEAEISGAAALLKRPVKDLAIALQELGANCTSERGYPPVRVRGPIKGGSVRIAGNVSSQYISALLLASPLAQGRIEITVSGRLESKSYVQMTLEMQRSFGATLDVADDLSHFQSVPGIYSPANVEIEGDWSSAAFLLAGAAIAGEKVGIQGLSRETAQADRSLLEILDRMNGQTGQESGSVTVEKSQLNPVELDASDCPDLFPAVCALSAAANGVSTIRGIRRLRIKESDRVLAMSKGLNSMGIKTVESEDYLVIHGGRLLGAVLDPHRDHRIAMALAVLGLCADEVTIVDAECVAKSYPSFWSDLQSLGAEVTVH